MEDSSKPCLQILKNTVLIFFFLLHLLSVYLSFLWASFGLSKLQLRQSNHFHPREQPSEKCLNNSNLSKCLFWNASTQPPVPSSAHSGFFSFAGSSVHYQTQWQSVPPIQSNSLLDKRFMLLNSCINDICVNFQTSPALPSSDLIFSIWS